MSIQLNIYLLYWYFQQNQCLNIKKHAVHNIYIYQYGPMSTCLPHPQTTALHAYELRRHWLNSIIKQFYFLTEDSIILPSFCLTSLLPSSNCYYRYHGSQTTPPCASVIWTMFKERIFLSEIQVIIQNIHMVF